MQQLLRSIQEIEKLGNYPHIDTIESSLGPKVKIDGIDYYLFSSNGYLGLSSLPQCKAAAIKAIEKYGTGSGASRIVSGTYDIHTKLENEIADFKEKESAMVLTSGYSANVSLIPVLANSFSILGKKPDFKTMIFSDEYNHASIIDGIKLSGSAVTIYPHKDMGFLEEMLQKHDSYRKLIITDSIFSMDGDIAPLDKIVELKKKYNAMLLIDEAHATGVIGKYGKGVANFLNVTKDVDIIMGTFSKALGSIGAYITSSREVIKLLKVAVRGYVFSTALPPPDLAVSREAIKILKDNPGLSDELQKKSNFLRDSLNKIGFSTLGSQTQIIPILIGDIMMALKFQTELRKRKIIAPCIQWPAVPRDKSRIRFSVMLTHSKEDIEYLINSCQKIKDDLHI